MPLTKEQFQKARDAGYTPEQIVEFEKKRQSEKAKPMFSSPEEAQAGQRKAQKEQKSAEFYATPMGNLAKASENTFNPITNSAMFGIPDIVSKKTIGKPFVNEDAQMKWLSEPAGALVGPGGVGRVIAKAAVPVIKGGLKMSTKGIPTVIKDTMGRKMGRGAIEGGVMGGTSLTSDEEGNFDVGQQGLQATGGALLGAAADPAAAVAKSFISKSGQAYRKFTRWRKGAVEPATSRVKGKVSVDEQNVQLTSAKRGAEQRQLDETFKSDLETTKAELQQNFNSLTKAFQESAETGAVKMQDDVKFVTKEMSKNYGLQFDDISDAVNSSAPIVNSEVSSLLSGVKAKLQDNLITSGHVNDILTKMESKYGEKFFGGAGFRISRTPRSTAGDAIDFKRFIKDVKDIKKGIKYGGKTEDNVALGIFYDDLTNFLGQREGLEKYLELNSAYAPYIQSLKEITRQTKAYVGDSSTKGATEMLKRFGLRKADVPIMGSGVGAPAEISEIRNIERFQQPSQFSKGFGTQTTDPVVARAKELYAARQTIDALPQVMGRARDIKSKNIDSRFIGELDNIMASKNYIEGDYLAKEAMVRDAIKSKMKRIGFQENKIDLILKDRNKLPNIIKRMAGNAIMTGGLVGSTVYGLKALSGGR